MSSAISKPSGLPASWATTTLGELKQFSLYGPRFSSKDYADEGVCVLRTTDISEGGKVNTAKAPKLPLSDEDFEKYCCKKGDLLITRTGNLGTLAVFNDAIRAIPGAYLIQYRLEAPEITSWYVFYFLKSSEGQGKLTGGGKGIGRPNPNAPTIEAIEIPLAPLPEQRRIVARIEELFSRLDAGVAALRHAKAQLQRYRQSVLAAAVTGQLTQAWREQHPDTEPAEELLERILNGRREKWSGRGKYKEPTNSIPSIDLKIPDTWTQATLDQVSRSIQDGNYGEQHPKAADYIETGIPFMSAAVIREDGRLEPAKFKYISREQHEKLTKALGKFRRHHLPKSRSSGTAASGLPDFRSGDSGSHRRSNINPQLTRLKLPDLLSHKFLCSVLCTRPFLDQFRKLATGSALGFVGLTKPKGLVVPLPPKAEQDQIVAEVEARTTVIDHLEAELDRQITRSNRLRQSTLQSAFAGEL